jgi:glutaredoxin 3
MRHFTLYTKPSCPYCVQAKRLIERKGDSYDELELGKDATREQLLERAPGARTVPQIFLDEELIGGFTELAEWYNHV